MSRIGRLHLITKNPWVKRIVASGTSLILASCSSSVQPEGAPTLSVTWREKNLNFTLKQGVQTKDASSDKKFYPAPVQGGKAAVRASLNNPKQRERATQTLNEFCKGALGNPNARFSFDEWKKANPDDSKPEAKTEQIQTVEIPCEDGTKVLDLTPATDKDKQTLSEVADKPVDEQPTDELLKICKQANPDRTKAGGEKQFPYTAAKLIKNDKGGFTLQCGQSSDIQTPDSSTTQQQSPAPTTTPQAAIKTRSNLPQQTLQQVLDSPITLSQQSQGIQDLTAKEWIDYANYMLTKFYGAPVLSVEKAQVLEMAYDKAVKNNLNPNVVIAQILQATNYVSTDRIGSFNFCAIKGTITNEETYSREITAEAGVIACVKHFRVYAFLKSDELTNYVNQGPVYPRTIENLNNPLLNGKASSLSILAKMWNQNNSLHGQNLAASILQAREFTKLGQLVTP
jgi:hypothetical protein